MDCTALGDGVEGKTLHDVLFYPGKVSSPL